MAIPTLLVFARKTKIILLPIMDYMQTPLYVGTLKLRQGEKGYRPKRFSIRQNGNDEVKDPKDVLDLLRSVSRIMIDRRSDMPEFTSMLSDFQLTYDMVDVCRLCLLNDRFNFLNTESIEYKDELICENCAKEELEKECAYKKVGDATFNMLFRMLHKTRDLNRILAMLDPAKLDPELTRFDTIESVTTDYNIDVAALPLHPEFKKLLTMEQLLPVQSLSVRGGLLDGQNQLIISATATGKTLIGELSGIENILKGKGNMLFLVPLVALANQKHEQFKKRYSSLGIKTYLRIGGGRIKELRGNVETIPLKSESQKKGGEKGKGKGTEQGKKHDQETVQKPRSIFVGTYEGVDQMIRAGTIGRLGDIGTVVIDEVHMLEDEERGPRLDGLINRLKYLYSQSQYIFLSATVGNPNQLAQGLDSLLIQYEERPVPLERHLIFTTPRQKMPFIRRLALEAFNEKSSKGYRGQTIVFTNSRHNCTMIASSMDSQNLHAAPYHAGLPPNIRKKVELGFERGHIAVVVTTAALAAGVDFPASQVIFETLAMGIEWLKSSEFMQMQGRAGRPDYHDLGRVVLLVEPEKRYGSQGMAEDAVAVRLLEGNVEDIDVEYDERAQLEQTLADAACISYNQTGRGTQVSLNALNTLHKTHLGHFDVKHSLNRLKEYGFIERESIRPTQFGKIVTTHFLDTDKAFIMYDMVKDGQKPVDILVQLSTFVNVFFKHQGALSKTLGTNVPKKVFQGAALDIVFSGEGLSQLEGAHQQELIDFALDFLNCTCKESPYCGCPEMKFSRKLIEARASGKDVAITIGDAYGLYAYTADLLNYFDDCVRNLEAVVLIAKMVGNGKVRKDATNLLKSMS